jgi:hypothetical protein
MPKMKAQRSTPSDDVLSLGVALKIYFNGAINSSYPCAVHNVYWPSLYAVYYPALAGTLTSCPSGGCACPNGRC